MLTFTANKVNRIENSYKHARERQKWSRSSEVTDGTCSLMRKLNDTHFISTVSYFLLASQVSYTERVQIIKRIAASQTSCSSIVCGFCCRTPTVFCRKTREVPTLPQCPTHAQAWKGCSAVDHKPMFTVPTGMFPRNIIKECSLLWMI